MTEPLTGFFGTRPWKCIFGSLVFALFFYASSARSSDAWQLDSKGSNVSFSSLKNESIAEPHRFNSISGSITKEGKASLSIDLHSVETLIPIRNERMIGLLFDQQRYALFNADLGQGFAQNLTEDRQINGVLQLNGRSKNVQAQIGLKRIDHDAVLAFTRYPIIIQVADFALSDGIERLRNIAGLTSINKAVPIHLVLLFRR